MKTKLEVGKEYWLSAQKISRGIYLGESNSGNFDFRITLGSKHTKPLGELDVMTSNLSVYSEYIPEKPWSFTTPIAMKCTEEQFNGVKDKLVEMGYSGCRKTISFDRYEYLTNRYGQIGHADCTDKYISKGNVSNWFESFNPDLFLALAAMTDKEDGIKGEWWKNPYNNNLFIQTNTSPNSTHPYFRKATAQEIIEHFEKKEFVLPYAYMVCVSSKEEYLSVLEYARTKGEFKEDFNDLTPNAFPYYIGMEKNGSWSYNNRYISACDGVKITFDQFKKYVLKETDQSCQIISIPPTKQATLFYDRVEITDWKPKEGDTIFGVYVSPNGIIYEKYEYFPHMEGLFDTGFIKRTESEAKQLVEKLKQAML